MRIRSMVVVAVLASGVLSCSDDSRSESAPTSLTTSAATTPATASVGPEGWLCHPDLVDDPCLGADLRTTTIDWQLNPTVVDAPPAVDPAADCLYVPPASTDSSAALEWARIDVARFRTLCRVFVPDVHGDADALAAQFDRYLAADGGDRPFLLLGHGQGADLLTEITRTRVDTDPALRARLLSAMLIGGADAVQVPSGQSIGGTFADLPLCGAPEQTGCVVTFHGYEAGTTPDDATPYFAGIEPGRVAACTSPAGLDGSKGQLRAATFPVTSTVAPAPTVDGLPAVDTPFVTLPEYYVAQCLDLTGGQPHLWIDRSIDPDDLRQPGPLTDAAAPGLGTPEHEVVLTSGDLLFLAERQIASIGS